MLPRPNSYNSARKNTLLPARSKNTYFVVEKMINLKVRR